MQQMLIQESVKKSGWKISYEKVTPAIAANFLKKNSDNRSLDDRRIKRYAQEMNKSHWLNNPQPLIFAPGDILLNGQHRLHAVIKANTAHGFLIVKGVDKEVYKVLDSGKARSPSDVLGQQGYVNTARLASAARAIILFEQAETDIPASAFKAHALITSMDILDVVEKYPDLQEEALHYTNSFRHLMKYAGGGPVIAAYYLMKKKNKKMAEEYFQGLNDGKNLDDNSVAYHVREKLSDLTAIAHNSGLRSIKDTKRLPIIVRGWNQMREGYCDTRLLLQKDIPIEIIK